MTFAAKIFGKFCVWVFGGMAQRPKIGFKQFKNLLFWALENFHKQNLSFSTVWSFEFQVNSFG